jgi:hypothetical protein
MHPSLAILWWVDALENMFHFYSNDPDKMNILYVFKVVTKQQQQQQKKNEIIQKFLIIFSFSPFMIDELKQNSIYLNSLLAQAIVYYSSSTLTPSHSL